MKTTLYFSLSSITILLSLIETHAQCTFGALYLSDLDAAQVYTFSLDGNLKRLKPRSIISVPGNPGQILDVTGSGTKVASISRGSDSLFFADGGVSFIQTGVTKQLHGDHYHLKKVQPTLITNSVMECARPTHFVYHDKKVAVFCDGNYDAVPAQLNSTVWVLDETLMGSSSSAVVFSTTLQGSHHGIAIPVDDDHVLHSIPTSKRVDREANSASRPDTFQVIDYNGKVLHSLNNTNDPNMSCTGFHGSSSIRNKFVLACDPDHGGLLSVNYNTVSKTYKSLKLPYPLSGHRSGTLADHRLSPYIVGNFANEDNTKFYLLAVEVSLKDPASASSLLPLEEEQCSFSFEMTYGKFVLIWLPTGTFKVYELKPEWSLVAEIKVIPDMTSCANTIMVPGYGKAIIIAKDTQKIYYLDLTRVRFGEGFQLYSEDLGFTPNSVVVSGVPSGAACYFDGVLADDDEYDHEDYDSPDEPDEKDVSTKSPSKAPVNAPETSPVSNPASTPVASPVNTETSAPVSKAPASTPANVATPTSGPCFSASAEVEVAGVGAVRMDSLKIGDSILTSNKSFSKVYSFGHYSPEEEQDVIEIFATNMKKALEISGNHMLYVNGSLAPALSVKIGDILVSSSGSDAVVKSVRTLTGVKGIYAPHTVDGTLVVNGVVASNYVALPALDGTSFEFQATLQHAAMSPYRLYCSLVGCQNESYNTNGLPVAVNVWIPVLEALSWILSNVSTVAVAMIGVYVYNQSVKATATVEKAFKA